MIDRIRNIIDAAVPNAKVHVFSPDGEHFEAIVISPSFENLSLVKQHQMVLKSLRDEFADRLHALQLKTFTPQKWEEVKSQYNVAE